MVVAGGPGRPFFLTMIIYYEEEGCTPPVGTFVATRMTAAQFEENVGLILNSVLSIQFSVFGLLGKNLQT
jgi:hypothetical protein